MRAHAPQFDKFWKMSYPTTALKAGDLQAALGSFAIHHLLDYRSQMGVTSDVYVSGFGVTLWLMGDRVGAANVWARVCDNAFRGRYSHSSTGTFQGGLLLWFASVWLSDEEWHDEAAALFDKLLRKKRLVMGAEFPAMLARMLRKEVDFEEIRSQAKRPGDERMALFYAGVRAYEEGDRAATCGLWMQVDENTYSTTELESYILKHERKELCKQEQPKSSSILFPLRRRAKL